MARVPNVGDLQIRDVSLSTDPAFVLRFDSSIAALLFSSVASEDVVEYGSFNGACNDDSGWSFDLLRPKDTHKDAHEDEAREEVLAVLDEIHQEQAFVAAFTPPAKIEGYTPDVDDEPDISDAFEPTDSPRLPVHLRKVLECLFLAHQCQEIRYRWHMLESLIEIRFVGLETAVYKPDRFTQALATKLGKWFRTNPITT